MGTTTADTMAPPQDSATASFESCMGDHYGASYTDALLNAAWVEGSLGADAEPPTWWQPEARQGRDNPGLTLKRSLVEVRCNDDAFELVLRGDAS